MLPFFGTATVVCCSWLAVDLGDGEVKMGNWKQESEDGDEDEGGGYKGSQEDNYKLAIGDRHADWKLEMKKDEKGWGWERKTWFCRATAGPRRLFIKRRLYAPPFHRLCCGLGCYPAKFACIKSSLFYLSLYSQWLKAFCLKIKICSRQAC